MAEPHSPLHDLATSEQVAELRAELAQVRARAEAEQRRLEQALELARGAPPSLRDPATVTQDVAGRQEIEALRNMLREKDRVIEQLTRQCRDLEDQLEDNFQQLDALRLRVQQRHADQTQRPRRASPPPPVPTATRRATVPPPLEPAARPTPSSAIPPPARGHPRAPGLLIGLLLGTLISLATTAGVWWSGHWPMSLMPASLRGTSVDRPADDGGAETASETHKDQPAATEAMVAAPNTAKPSPVRGQRRDGNGPRMIALNPATFRMGNPSGFSGSDARPAREVSLPAFLIGEREVSFADYDRFVRATGARRPNDHGFGRGKQPVIDVTWDDAVAYTRWLSRGTGRKYRLPTEAEWEYAARAGSTSLYWWGSEAPAGRAVCLDCGSRFDHVAPAPTGFSGPNAFGLYDTAGNVYEWVADCYRPSYTDAPTDGSAVDATDCPRRVARGGSFKAPAKSMHVYARRAFEADTRVDTIGFRVARDAR